MGKVSIVKKITAILFVLITFCLRTAFSDSSFIEIGKHLKAKDYLKYMVDKKILPGYKILLPDNKSTIDTSGSTSNDKNKDVMCLYYYDRIYEKNDKSGKQVHLKVFIFDSRRQAFNYLRYAQSCSGIKKEWGGTGNKIIGDMCWCSMDNAGFDFLKGKVFVQLEFFKDNDKRLLENMAENILKKIEKYIDKDMFNEEKQELAQLKEKQLSTEKTEALVKSITENELKEYKNITKADSCWFKADDNYELGRRYEWEGNDNTTGIEICRFDTAGLAKEAVTIRNKETNGNSNIIEDTDNPVKVLGEILLKRYNLILKYGETKFFGGFDSVLFNIDKYAIQLYTSSLKGIDRELFEKIISSLKSAIEADR